MAFNCTPELFREAFARLMVQYTQQLVPAIRNESAPVDLQFFLKEFGTVCARAFYSAHKYHCNYSPCVLPYGKESHIMFCWQKRAREDDDMLPVLILSASHSKGALEILFRLDHDASTEIAFPITERLSRVLPAATKILEAVFNALASRQSSHEQLHVDRRSKRLRAK